MSISPETIDQIRLSVDIVELVREYIPNLKKIGRNWKALCPFHNEKTPSFIVSSEKGIFHCFGCNCGGDAFKFIMQMDNISWGDSVRKLAKRCGIEIKETKAETIRKSEKQKLYHILEDAANFYHRSLKQSSEASFAREYLKNRGVNQNSIDNFLLGYAPSGSLISSATKKGHTIEELIKAGIITKTASGRYYEYMSERLVFPIVDIQGRIVAFGGRSLRGENPKYINTPETSVYSKSAHLYGLHYSVPSLRSSKEVIVLEGYMDVVLTHQFDIHNTIATLGTALTSQHANILKRYVEKIILLFDADDAGNQAAKRAIEVFIESDIYIRVVNLPESLDPDEYVLKYGKQEFKNLLTLKSKSSIEFLIDLAVAKWGISTPEEKVKTSYEVLPLLNKIKNGILKQEWISFVSSKLKIDENIIQNELRRLHMPTFGKKSENIKTIKLLRSVEEEILQILLNFPKNCSFIDENIFCDKRNKRVFNLIASGISCNQIVNHLDEIDVNWFTELFLEEKLCVNPEQTLNNLIKDVNQKQLEKQMQELKKEIEDMIDGKIPINTGKYQLYRDLTKKLKGSVKI